MSAESSAPILEVDDLVVEFRHDSGYFSAVDGLSYSLRKGETLGVVGESGSGKSVTNLAVMGLLPRPPARIPRGQIRFHGKDLVRAPERELQKIRGNRIAMIFQDPMTSLNPYLKVSRQLVEVLELHQHLSGEEARAKALQMLEHVGIPGAKKRFDQYPHQFSGGMRQRVMIAMMLLNRPEVLIADEPTTALDVTIQAQILDLLKDLQREIGMAITLITHDLGVVAGMADQVIVMYAGRVMEQGLATEIFRNPSHPYTLGLLQSIPRPDLKVERLYSIPGRPPDIDSRPPGCPFAPRCRFKEAVCETDRPPMVQLTVTHRSSCFAVDKVRRDEARGELLARVQRDVEAGQLAQDRGRCLVSAPLVSLRGLKVHFPIREGALFKKERRQSVRAVDGVDLDIQPGETVGLVGESGCGKSTTGRAILQLYSPRVAEITGQVLYAGTDLAELGRKHDQARLRPFRKDLQIIFQDPYASLNPRMTVGSTIAEPLKIHRLEGGVGIERRVKDLLETVGLSPTMARRYPHEFSGGQRQRIGIARALAVNPKFIVCDEPISALDVSIQAQVMNLMAELQQRFNLTYLFIAHDLAAVKHISNRIAVMYLGRIAELAAADRVYEAPLHPYTQALISAVPIPDPEQKNRRRIQLEGEIPSPISPPSGCRFHPRCPYAESACKSTEPQLTEVEPGRFVACHPVARGMRFPVRAKPAE